ncbi:energy-coupling factor transport system permease protein [Hydrogenispora ethanolica]|uniref:Energy-coupling factor transport system permease protein n=1 Tax=Hydrogenispora ethanolica TaxID=1082276 RepID=A0A4R1R5R8_HYDET|nr:energy-coupling factor transporter transmembrane component T [Hydrogenispora ethanolica]TCL60876.1 energy-coupling factor transport system permease protein [Hydrogenispora ethanolica]
MNRSGALYIERDSFFHRLDGSVKLLMLVAWSAFVFMFMDLRIFGGLIVAGAWLLYLSKLPFRAMKPLIILVMVFTFFNSLFLILVTPEYGSQLAGRRTVALQLWGVGLTWETLCFALTLSLKYLAILPITLLFLLTTHPSSFAGSLNRLGVPYQVAYAVNIALRYIPDVHEEVQTIIHAQEARGVEFQKGEAGILRRLRNYGTVLLPLLVTSLHRVEVVSNAMDLRGFGKHPARTWYSRKPLTRQDLMAALGSLLLVGVGLYLRKRGLGKFWVIG